MKSEPLPIETIDNPNSVEEIFCKAMDKASREETTGEDSEILIGLVIQGKPVPTDTVEKKDKFFLYELIEKRVAGCFTFTITDSRVIVFLSVISRSAGTAVMYLTYLQYRCKKEGVTELSLDFLCRTFPMGFVPDSELKEIWDNQKVKRKNMSSSDNLLDYQSAMKSIQYDLTKA